MKKKARKYFSITIAFCVALLYLAKFGGPALLKAYIATGIGNCRTMPLLCIVPDKEINYPEIDKTYLQELLPYYFPGHVLPYSFPAIEVSIPKGFSVVKGSVTKVYYKRRKYNAQSPTVYILYQKPKFFINLFPQLKKQGMENNYDFVSRTQGIQFTKIDNLTDAFFVIMKSVFTPNLGKQDNIKMVKFTNPGKKGFITYNLASSENYFDCDVISGDDSFFKIYIRDNDRILDLEKVIAIISTLETPGTPDASK